MAGVNVCQTKEGGCCSMTTFLPTSVEEFKALLGMSMNDTMVWAGILGVVFVIGFLILLLFWHSQTIKHSGDTM